MNVWHHPLTVLDEAAAFAILMWRTGGPGDEEFTELRHPLPGRARLTDRPPAAIDSTGDSEEAAMARFPEIAEAERDAAQRRVAEAIRSGPRGAIVGPFLPLFHSPELSQHVQRLGAYIRFESAVAGGSQGARDPGHGAPLERAVRVVRAPPPRAEAGLDPRHRRGDRRAPPARTA